MDQQLREFFRINLQLKIFLKKIFYDKETGKYILDNSWQLLKTKDISAKGMFIFKDRLSGDFSENDYILIKFTIPGKLEDTIYLIGKIVRILTDGFAVNYTLIGELNRDKLINSFLKITHEELAKKLD